MSARATQSGEVPERSSVNVGARSIVDVMADTSAPGRNTRADGDHRHHGVRRVGSPLAFGDPILGRRGTRCHFVTITKVSLSRPVASSSASTASTESATVSADRARFLHTLSNSDSFQSLN